MAKVALLIGVSEYEPGLNALPGAPQDVAVLKQALQNPQIGGFDQVRELLNPDPQIMLEAIELIFADRRKDDLVVLFFSGHGIKDDQGRLYFATPRTRQTNQGGLIRATAVSASVIHDYMSNSRAKRQVVILDCCFSGAFATNMPAKSPQIEDISADIREQLGAEGRAVLTSSTATQYSFEQSDATSSVYTRYLVQGLETGAADLDGDGAISVDELHEYARSKVQEAAPAMKPEIYAVREGYKIKLAKAALGDPKLVYRKEVTQNLRNRTISVVGRRILNRRQVELGLTKPEADAIEAEVLQPYREYEHNLQEYEQALVEAIEQEEVLSPETREDLKRFQQLLKLRDEDIAPIQAKFLEQTLEPSPQPQSDPATYFEFEVITVNAEGKEKSRSKGRAEYFIEDLGNGVMLEMVKIPAGEFWMGTAEEERDTLIQEYTRHGVEQAEAEEYISWEMPQHRVVVPVFWMGKFAVTQAQWSRVAQLPKVKLDLNPIPTYFKGANRPVEGVSWNEAIEFCDRLNRFVAAWRSQKTGNQYRLPSEAEWEFACRAGTTTPFHFGETITTDLVNCNSEYPFGNALKGKYRAQTTDVGSFPVNAFGLFDVHGNVWEWCADHWHENYQGAPIDGSAWLSNNQNSNRLMRGGSWDSYPRGCRSAFRDYSTPGDQSGNLGFRVVCGLV